MSSPSSPPTTLIFGGRGQLGHELALQLRERGDEVVALGREECDVTDMVQIERALHAHAPAVVFNATAYNAVDKAQEEPDAAMRLNAVAPGQIAMACARHDAMCIHFSTDYVFGDGHDSPISELEQPAPMSAYGKSKLLGEELVLGNHPAGSFVVRCCGLYGERRANFVRTMVRVALAGRPLKVVSDQLISPTWVRPLATRSIALLDARDRAPRGVYHIVAGGACSWHDFAAAIFEALSIDADLSPVLQADWGAPAPRPSYSVLDTAMLRVLHVGEEMPDWRTSLHAFLGEYGEAIVREEQMRLEDH